MWPFTRKSTRKRDLQFVPYSFAPLFIKCGYTIAKEEDDNAVPGWVFLEKTEEVNRCDADVAKG